MTEINALMGTADEIRELPTASKLRLAADILEKMEQGAFADIDKAFRLARTVTSLALLEMETK